MASHPFMVIQRGVDASGNVLGRFASLYCAAQTALSIRKGGAVVQHAVTGDVFERSTLISVRVESVVPLVFAGVGIKTGRQAELGPVNKIYATS